MDFIVLGVMPYKRREHSMNKIINSDILVDRIKKKMDELKINQSQLAKNAGITPAALSQILSKDRTPSSEVLVKLSRALQVSVDYLVGQAEDVNLDDLLQNNKVQVFFRDFSTLSETDKKTIEIMIEALKKKGSDD